VSGDMATVQPRLGPGHRIMTTPAFGSASTRTSARDIAAATPLPRSCSSSATGPVAETGTGIVPADLMTRARWAVANCPEYAISLTEFEP
jgi:hypothetical protein